MKKYLFVMTAFFILAEIAYAAETEPTKYPEQTSACPPIGDTEAAIPQQCDLPASALDRHAKSNPADKVRAAQRVAEAFGNKSSPKDGDASDTSKKTK
jgi:hypothetical protein